MKLLEGKDGSVDSDDDQWFNAKGTWDDNLGEIPGENDVIWKKDYFLMSNASVSTRLFPPSIDDWDPYSSESSPFNLSGMNSFGRPNEVDNLTDRGNIAVERVAARYDFRDGAINKPDGADETYNGWKAQTYHVVLDAKKNPLVDVFLGRMSIVNMNRNYYYLRRVSNNGQQTPYQNNGEPNKLTICGPEMPWIYDSDGSIAERGNYIVDADWKWKYSGNNVFSDYNFAQKLNYPFFDNDGILDNVDESNGRWDTYKISDVLKGDSDNWNNQVENGQEKPNSGSYHIWRYLTEGTIPGINSQKNGVSNGIVFKGQMLPGRDAVDSDDYYTKLLLNALKVVDDQSPEQVEKNHLIFKYGGHLYCGWEHIRRMAIQLAITDPRKEDGKWVCSINRSVGLYNAVFGTGGFGEVTFQIEGDDVQTANFMIEEGKGNATLTDVMTDVDTASANALFNSWHHSGFGDENTAYTNFRNTVVNNKITIYQESYDETMGGWAYYCYYYYWNRHNDNGVTGVMGPMEFAVVRNNVYKLAVTKIAQLGHPRIVVNDPDAPDPNTPDEKADVYITVTCTTLPWVVRENGIEF